MTPLITDLSLHCKIDSEQVIKINGSYVHDLLFVGTRNQQINSNQTLEIFETAGNKQSAFTFAGMQITYILITCSTLRNISI